jgi:hypothetical protein
MAYKRDPLSELFDPAARRLLERAYASPGQWAGTRLADPSPRHLAWCAGRGINPFGPDDASVIGTKGGTKGGTNARTRWARGFVRALYYQHKWWSGSGTAWRTAKRSVARETGALEVQVGRAVQAYGVFPAGRSVRIRLLRGGQAADRAVRRLADGDRIYADDGSPAGRWSDPELRGW